MGKPETQVSTKGFILYIVDIRHGERDLLTKIKRECLVIRSLDGSELHRQPAPTGGWTFDMLTNIQPRGLESGADAYIGDVWVGSTEV